jgi:3-hydroxyisobutyrate dehydrogenase-like beta-hydroxyacid dehydrogenase
MPCARSFADRTARPQASAMASSSTRTVSLRNRIADIVSGDHQGWFATRLGAKDLRLVEELARSQGVPLPVAEAVKRLYEEAAAEGWSDADVGAVVELVRRPRASSAAEAAISRRQQPVG